MYSKISLVVLIILLQISCAEMADKPFLTTENKIPKITSTPEKIVNRSKIEPNKMEKMVIYWSALDRIYDDDEHGNTLGSMNYKDLVYRIEGVSPQGVEQIEDNQDISQSLINNLKAANQKPETILENGYPGTRPTKGYSGSRDMAKFYKEAKRRNPDTGAVVCFSNIGIDESYTETLVYAEYYRPDKGLVTFYLQMKMELLQTKIDDDSFSGVESYNLIQVY